MDCPQPPPRGVIFDLGDVLFKWSAKTTTSIPPRKLREMLSMPVWHSYERDEITRDVCYELSAREFSLSKSDIAEAFVQARSSLQPDDDVVSFLRGLRKDHAVKVYAMSNVGNEDFEELANKMDWTLFDRVFTSGVAGMRKPELGLYQHVLHEIGLSCDQVAFVDDKEENVQAARSLGIRGFVFGDSTVDSLREMLDSPVAKGWRYLFQNTEQCKSITNSGVSFADNLAKLLIIDLLHDRSLFNLSWGSRETWNFFADEAVLVPGGIFPDDLDTPSLALTALRPPSTQLVSSILDEMAKYVNADGTFQTYFDRGRNRVDPIVSANILACFYSYGRGHEFEATVQLVRSVLLDRSYKKGGTRYYPSPDCCLGFIGRLLSNTEDTHLHETLGPLLESRVRERLGMAGSALDLAMRIVTCVQLDIPCEQDRRALLELQCADGSWEPGWMYRYGSTGVTIGNRGVTTAMAVRALSSQNMSVKGNGSNSPDGTERKQYR